MGFILFLALLGVPIVEITLFILIGGQIGVIATLACILATAIIGAMLVRRQGLATFERARREMQEDRVPAGALSEGLAILAAGALLMTPGFFTDTVGFLLLIPPLRRRIIRHVGQLLASRVTVMHGGPERGPRTSRGGATVIDGEAVEVEEPEDDKRLSRDDSPWRSR